MERRAFLAQRRNIESNRRQGIYPFRNIKLSRADVEWLLTIYGTNEQESIDRSEMSLRGRKGLDLRGADLCSEDLSNLPFAELNNGLHMEKLLNCSDEQREWAAIHLEGANLSHAHLQGACLNQAFFDSTTELLLLLHGHIVLHR